MTTDPNHTDEPTTECPTCEKPFDTEAGVKIHHAQVHDESLVETNCEVCGRTFKPHPTNNVGKFCSRACYGETLRVTVELECEECDAPFEVAPADRDDRRFCSPRCASKNYRNRVTLECHQCTRVFSVPKSNADHNHCCAECRFEAQRTIPREFNSPEDLCLQLYVDEGYNLDKTFRRQRAVLGHDDRLYKTEVRELLVEMGVFERMHQRVLTDNDGDLLGETPAGDDSWQRFYGGAADD